MLCLSRIVLVVFEALPATAEIDDNGDNDDIINAAWKNTCGKYTHARPRMRHVSLHSIIADGVCLIYS